MKKATLLSIGISSEAPYHIPCIERDAEFVALQHELAYDRLPKYKDYPVHKWETITYANKYINWGAGPRASQFMIIGAKTHAILNGKYSPDIEDVNAVVLPVLRHRIIKNYKAEAENISVEKIVSELINS